MSGSPDENAKRLGAFRKGLAGAGLTANTLGIAVPPKLPLIADEVIE
jgi:hypothetical protein